MKKLCLILALCLMLSGCGSPTGGQTPETTEPAPIPTVPADGIAGTITSKGTYTAPENPNAVVARVGSARLTNRELQAWYWATVAQYRQEERGLCPEESQPLDTQPCPLYSSVHSWQQYFLHRALVNWHTAQALILQGEAEGLPREAAYKPVQKNREKYMDGMPATKVLYAYEASYQPNTMHQAFLDNIPELLKDLARKAGLAEEEALAQAAFGTTGEGLRDMVETYNRGYMYLTAMSYYCEPTEEEILAFYETLPEAPGDQKPLVDIRQVLLTGADAQARAEALLEEWADAQRVTEGTFADMAHKHSQDSGSGENGGLYRQIRQGQLIPELELWSFDPSREPGDTAIVESSQGVHILYFRSRTQAGLVRAEAALQTAYQQELMETARKAWPMEVAYEEIALGQAQGNCSLSDVLYADVAHERFPEAPLYIQQDYYGTLYGGSKIVNNGCGITTMAMLASYMTDDELTPPEMADRYYRYGSAAGTDGTIFNKEPAEMGFYLIEKTYDWKAARAYMEEGYLVVVIQYKGFWTSGGHYLLLEKMDDDGLVQVRDSNLYNYGRLEQHQQDRFPWSVIYPQGMGYWVFDNKITRIPACSRCGSGEGLAQDYVCEKCSPALLRRNNYLQSER